MLAYIPVWVFAILALLLALGFVQSRPRLVAPRVIRSVAVGLALYSLWGVVGAFGFTPLPVLCWALGLVAALVLARSLVAPRGMVFDAQVRRVQVPGSWLPLVLMLGIFGVKFGLGFSAGMGAPVQSGSLVAATAAAMLGLLSGLFLARARAVLAMVPRA
jgi:hypothetical protein